MLSKKELLRSLTLVFCVYLTHFLSPGYYSLITTPSAVFKALSYEIICKLESYIYSFNCQETFTMSLSNRMNIDVTI